MLRRGVEDVLELLRVNPGLVDGRVRGGLDDPEEEALILRPRQLFLREHVERKDEKYDDRPQRQDDRTVLQRAGHQSLVEGAQLLETAVDEAREAPLGIARA